MSSVDIAPLTTLAKLGRHASSALGIADQLTTSATSVVVVVLGARQLSVNDFGRFALMYTLSTFIVGLVRAYLVEPQLVEIRASDKTGRRNALAAGLHYGLRLSLVALVVAVVVVVSPLKLSSTPPCAVLCLIVWMGTLDSYRFRLLGSGVSHFAVTIGLSVLFLTIGLMLAVHPDHYTTTIWTVALAYGIAVCVVTAATLVIEGRGFIDVARRAAARARRRPETRTRARHYASEFLLGYGAYYFATVFTSLLVGVRVAAGLRGSESVLGPIRVSLTVLPNAIIATSHAKLNTRRNAARMSAALAAWAALCGAFAIFVAMHFASTLFGATGHLVKMVLPYLAMGPVFTALSTGPIIGLRYTGRSDVTVRIRAIVAVVLVGTMSLGAFWGVTGIAIGAPLASALACAIWWTSFWRLTRETDVPVPVAQPASEPS